MRNVVVTFELSEYWYDLCVRALNRSDSSFVYKTLMNYLLGGRKINFDGYEISE